ncbi:MAG: hypothetical protein ABIE07_14140 [Candidatus Zixiibacteriota bacterium]
MKYYVAILLIIIFLGQPRSAFGGQRDTFLDIIGEYEGGDTFGLKAFVHPGIAWATKDGADFSFFMGVKFSIRKPKGEKYNWSQSRAEEFYKSEFMGYSDVKYLGLNTGLSFYLFKGQLCLYGGGGVTNSRQYRCYHDDTFTKWSNDYYLESGMIEEYIFDGVFGSNIIINQFVIGVGYSTGLSTAVFGAGFRI